MSSAIVPAPWVAVHVRPNHESLTASLLHDRGYEEYLPLRPAKSQRQRVTPLFRGYLFCRYTHSPDAKIVTTPGVIRILGPAHQPIYLTEQEIERIRTICESRLEILPHPYLTVGQYVRLIQGPLKNLEGIILSFRGITRLVVSLNLLKRSISVEIDSSWAIAAGEQNKSEPWLSSNGVN